jgi:hypothetical protein
MALAGTGALAVIGVTGCSTLADDADDRVRDHVEAYQGRHIRITQSGGAYIDGRQLHLMKMGDGAYLSALCHYELAETPLIAARRAVDELRGANLLAATRHHA